MAFGRLGRTLRREKTNVGVSTSTTFNSPGTYNVPYGKTVVRLAGRGASGNPTQPAVPGNYVPGNHVDGNFAYNHPGHYYYYPQPGNFAFHQPGGPDHGGGGYVQFTPGQQGPYPWTGGPWPGPPCSVGLCSDQGWTPAWAGQQVQFINTYWHSGYQPGYDVYNPENPGPLYYQPPYPVYNPGTHYPGFNNPTQPAVPGNSGQPATLYGVTFPGGGSDQTAPVVPTSTSTISYTGSGITITVPSGGYITVSNV